MDDFRTEVDEHGNIKVTSYVEAVVISKEEQEQSLRIFKQLQEENDKLRELVVRMRPICVEGKRCTFADRIYINNTMEELRIEVCA